MPWSPRAPCALLGGPDKKAASPRSRSRWRPLGSAALLSARRWTVRRLHWHRLLAVPCFKVCASRARTENARTFNVSGARLRPRAGAAVPFALPLCGLLVQRNGIANKIAMSTDPERLLQTGETRVGVSVFNALAYRWAQYCLQRKHHAGGLCIAVKSAPATAQKQGRRCAKFQDRRTAQAAKCAAMSLGSKAGPAKAPMSSAGSPPGRTAAAPTAAS
jgi:hypothetical protein